MSQSVQIDEQRAAVANGLCPECGEKIAGWRPPVGEFLIPAFRELKANGVDPLSGHKRMCSLISLLRISE